MSSSFLHNNVADEATRLRNEVASCARRVTQKKGFTEVGKIPLKETLKTQTKRHSIGA